MGFLYLVGKYWNSSLVVQYLYLNKKKTAEGVDSISYIPTVSREYLVSGTVTDVV